MILNTAFSLFTFTIVYYHKYYYFSIFNDFIFINFSNI